MASVEISPLLAWNSHKFIYFPPFLCCISSPILKLLRHCDGSNKKDHTEYCWEPPWLLRAVAASASVWGPGSLQVLELTPASPVSTFTRWPPSLRPAVLLKPRVYFTGPLSMTFSQRSPESCSSWFEWTHPRSAWGAHSTSPRVLYKGLNPKYWSFLCLVLALTFLRGPQGFLWILSGPRVRNSPASIVFCSSVS